MSIFESTVEEASISWFKELGYSYLYGLDIAPDGEAPERKLWSDVVLADRFRSALSKINSHLSESTLEDVFRQIVKQSNPSAEECNFAFQKWIIKGIPVQIQKEGGVRGDQANLFDLNNPENNDWLIVNQYSVKEGQHTRRPDVVVFVNGLPLAVIELKNPEDENATLESAWNQIQTYKLQIPSLFKTNEILIISDGIDAKVGSLTAGFERFSPWRTVDGSELASEATPKLEVVIKGIFVKQRFLDYIRHFVLWETDDGYIKKIAGYHQFHAVNKSVEQTIRASCPEGNKRIGVIWHTQGSGKSILMTFFAAKLRLVKKMNNPTLVIITDRNDLDGQLFSQFSAAKDLISPPSQATSRDHLKELLQVSGGGVVFSTIQKFSVPKGEDYPLLSDRHNIIVIADEAHRSQYEFIEGFARNLRDGLPFASYIGFTGTPIENDDINTPAVFGDYIDTYTISQSVDDKATVPLFYEPRLAKIELPEEEKPVVDDRVEEVTEGEDEEDKQKLKAKWSKLEAMVGTEKRLNLVAQDILDHWDRRLEILDGKAMIVTMSRRICIGLYDQIISLRPAWHSEKDEEGSVKIVMTGAASDPLHFQPHLRSKDRQKQIEKRFKDPNDPLRFVIVRDMWLTGFDVPCAHTLYLDKPMRGHSLMQAIARVNRVFRDKPAGLIVDYLGIAEQLRQAIGTYGGRKGTPPAVPVDEALKVLLEKYDVVKAMFHGFDFSDYFKTAPTKRLSALSGGLNYILSLEEGRKRYLDAMAPLNRATALAIHLEGARHLRDDIGYFQSVEKNIRKHTVGGGGKGGPRGGMDEAIRQIVSDAIAPQDVIDIFREAGLQKPDISILSDEFLQTVKEAPNKNLQMELLRKLLNDEVKSMSRRNVVQSRKFSEMLEKTILQYQNRTLEAAQVILELIEMAKQIRDLAERGNPLNLNEDEVAFYDALAAHGNVKELMGDKVLSDIAVDLVRLMRQSVSIDWTIKESVRAKMRVQVKKLLRKHGYPPDQREEAVLTVIEQAEQVCREWA